MLPLQVLVHPGLLLAVAGVPVIRTLFSLARYLNIATDSVRTKSPSLMTGTFCRGFILVYSSVLVSPAVILTPTCSWGMPAALQKITTALAGWDIRSANTFKLILPHLVHQDSVFPPC